MDYEQLMNPDPVCQVTGYPRGVSEMISRAANQYLPTAEGERGLHRKTIALVERPLLEAVMKHTRHNQCRAAEILGMNRGTLRTKLQQYGINRWP